MTSPLTFPFTKSFTYPFTKPLGTIMGRGGSSIIIPGTFDSMQALNAAYSLFGVQQLVSSGTYHGYAYRAVRSSDNAALDFLPSTTSLALATWGQAVGAAQIYLTKLYDQSGNGRNSDTLTASVAGTAPTLDCSVSVYPVVVFNGTTNRISWTGGSTLQNINMTAVGITLASAMQPVGVPSATGFVQMISQSSGNSSRTSIDLLVTPNFSVRTNRGDGNAFSAAAPTSWNLNPNILINVTDYPGGTVKRYVNGTVGTTQSFTSLPSPNFVQSSGVLIGGANTQNFAAMRWTCSAFYDVAITTNIAALESAMEASA